MNETNLNNITIAQPLVTTISYIAISYDHDLTIITIGFSHYLTISYSH